MAQVRTLHPNAALTPKIRRRMVGCVMEQGWSVAAAAERFQVDPKTVRKWRDRYRAEGRVGLPDRSSRPRNCPWRTPDAKRSEGSICGTVRRRTRPFRPRLAAKSNASTADQREARSQSGRGIGQPGRALAHRGACRYLHRAPDRRRSEARNAFGCAV